MGQPNRQDAIVKGIVGLRKVAFPLNLLHDFDYDLRTLFVLTSMSQMMEQFQQPLPCLPELLVAVLPRSPQIFLLCFTHIGGLHPHLNAIDESPIGHDRRHHCLKSRHAPLSIVITLGHPVTLGAPLMMGECPIQTKDLTSPPA